METETYSSLLPALHRFAKSKTSTRRLWQLDQAYVTPNPDLVRSTFWGFRRWRFLLKLEKYITGQNDCENFALLYKVFADRNLGADGYASAVGVCFYTPDNGVYHAINFMVHDGNVLFIEPQTKGRADPFIGMSETEKSTLDYVLL